MGLDPASCPLKARPKRYDIEARRRLSMHLAKLMRTGVIRRASIWEQRTSNVVLVPEGQSG